MIFRNTGYICIVNNREIWPCDLDMFDPMIEDRIIDRTLRVFQGDNDGHTTRPKERNLRDIGRKMHTNEHGLFVAG
jgi:hypothetical protein